MSYREIYRQSLENPDQFWAEAASGLDWTRPWEKVLDETPVSMRWTGTARREGASRLP
jgi:hypothetical protein